ncbi:MAG: hypothetical protein Q9167_007403, partial [Letrouitia subvulpina]
PDATSSSLASTFFYLLRNDEAYGKLCEEIRCTFEHMEDIVPGKALSTCTYLRACLDEAMRMNPANGSALWREVICEGAVVDGRPVPAGVDVGVGIYSIHHQADYFPDPYKYYPERWIVNEGNPKETVKLAQSAWAPFSLGPRGCAGKAAAIMQLSIGLARVVFLYDMRTPADPNLAMIGQGVKGAKFPWSLETEFQVKGTFSNILHGPMIEFKKREV